MKKHLKQLFLVSLTIISLFLSSCHVSRRVGPGHSSDKTEHYHISEKNKRGKKVIEEALKWEGTPYKYAGSDRKTGTDCSGMVMSVYLDATGIKLPRNSAKQAEYCKKISSSKVETGDLCFFATGKDPKKISHVGIMIDEENFIHASTSKGVVISKITTPYYTRTFIQFGRVPSE
ncbi:MAG: C40 family peptidase [Muribaculaceae bacterium]|nr:C40 family peptidase [Muribaculaceae bacterium]